MAQVGSNPFTNHLLNSWDDPPSKGLLTFAGAKGRGRFGAWGILEIKVWLVGWVLVGGSWL